MNKIKEKIAEFQRTKEDALKNYGQVCKLYNSFIEMAREECEHEWEFIPDPSGGSDSFYCCNNCGLEKSRLPKKSNSETENIRNYIDDIKEYYFGNKKYIR